VRICSSFHVRVSRVCSRFPEETAASVEWQLVSGCWHLLIEFSLLRDRMVRKAIFYSSDEIPDRMSDRLTKRKRIIVKPIQNKVRVTRDEMIGTCRTEKK